MLKVAIIILAYNSQQHLTDCLGSLSKLVYPRDKFRVFLFDNDSKDNTISETQKNFPEVKIVANRENLGFAAGNNKAINYVLAQGYEAVFLINDDTITDPECLNQLVDVIEQNDQIGAVQARLMLYPEKTKVNSLGNSLHYLGFGFSSGGYQTFNGDMSIKEITYFSGAAVLIKRSVFEKIGIFDPDFFMYHDDLDLGWRMRLAGYSIKLAPQAVVYHKYQFSKSIKKYFFMERNRFICVLENYKWGTIALITPACLVMELGLFLFSIKSGFVKEKLRVYAYFLKVSSWRKIFKHRKEKKQYRVVKDKEIIKYFTGKIEFQEIDNWLLNKVANPIFNLYWQIIRKIIIW